MSHSNHRIINGHIAVRMIAAQNRTHHGRRFPELGSVSQTVFIHGVKNPAMDGLQPVPDIGQSPGHDHRHGVINVRLLHLGHDFSRLHITDFNLLFNRLFSQNLLPCLAIALLSGGGFFLRRLFFLARRLVRRSLGGGGSFSEGGFFHHYLDFNFLGFGFLSWHCCRYYLN